MSNIKHKLRASSTKWHLFVLMFSCILFAGCGSTNTVEKTTGLVFAIAANDKINPDFKGNPSSVVVRIYQLKNRVNFDKARYEELFNPAQNKLGAEFIAVNEYLIDPSSNMELDLDISAATKFIGVAVGFRGTEDVNWKTIIAMPENSSLDPLRLFSGQGVQIFIDELSVRVEAL